MDFSLILPILVTVVGVILLIRLGAFFIIHPIRTTREIMDGLKDRKTRRAFCLALAGTLGVGNIFGVSAGIMIGGPGSLFWLFISTFFAMVIKYAETLLVFDGGANKGGMAIIIRNIFSRFGKAFSILYAALTVALALFMGSAMQSAALIDSAEQTISLKPVVTLVILLILFLPCLLGGGRKIESITEILIPLTTIIYIIGCFAVIFINFSRLDDVIFDVFSSAFSFRSALGGGVSFLAIKEGFARGILSNEAGVGTSAMAHIRSRERSPHKAGLFAMSEVLFDSTLLCILTGIAILVSVDNISGFSTPMSLVSEAFSSSLGGGVAMVLPFIILSFAYATIICWYYYGMECMTVFFPKISRIFSPAFIFFMLVSWRIRSQNLLCVIDIILLLMSILTLCAIVKKSKRIAEISKHCQKKDPE